MIDSNIPPLTHKESKWGFSVQLGNHITWFDHHYVVKLDLTKLLQHDAMDYFLSL